MYKYLMNNDQDYRQGLGDGHGVKHIKKVGDNDIAYGEFAIIDGDMLECTEEEVGYIEDVISLA